MSGNANTIQIAIEVDDRGSVKIRQLGASADKAGQQGEESFRKAGRSLGDFSDRAHAATGVIGKLMGLIGSAYALQAMIRQFVQAADSISLMQGKLALVNGDMEVMYELSMRTRQGLEPTVEIFTRLSRATKEYGFSQQEVLSAVESVQKAIIVSGANAQESEAAIIQLSQGMASGALRGDELRSVMEQIPRVAIMIADGLGVSIGQLRKMGEEGELTTGRLMEAFAKSSAGIQKEFEQMPLTIGQSMTMLQSSITLAIGKMDQMEGTSGKVARAIVSISEAVAETPRYFAGLLGLLDGARASFTQFIISIETGYLKILKVRLAIAEMINDNHVGDYLVPDSVISSTKTKIGELEASISIWKDVLDDTNKSGERHAAIFSGLIPIIAKTKTNTDSLGKSTIDNSAAMEKQEKAIIKVDKALESYFDTLDKTVRKLEEERIAALDSFYTLNDDEEAKRVDEMWQKRIDREKEAQDASKKRADDEKKQVADYQKAWEHMLERLQDAGADFFYDWFSGAENGWRNLMGNLKDYFLRMLAELAAAAIARPIAISVVGTVAGALGGDSNIASAAGSAGGGGDLLSNLSIVKSLSSAFGGHGSIAGNLSSAAGWGWIQDAAGAMVDFSSNLAGVAEAFSNFGGWVESLPVIGDMGISGVLSAGMAVYDLTQGNTKGAIVHGIGAGLSYINPVLGAAWEFGNMVGNMIFGGYEAEPEYRARYQVKSQTHSRHRMLWQNTGTTGEDIGQAATNQINQAIFDLLLQWDRNLLSIADAMGESGKKWQQSIKYAFDLNMNQDINSAADVETLLNRMNESIFDNLAPTLNQGLNIFWADAKAGMAKLPVWNMMSAEWLANINSQVASLPKLSAADTAQEGMDKFNTFIQEIAGIDAWMQGVNTMVDDIRSSLRGETTSEFEKSYLAVEEQFASWGQQLQDLGINLKKFPELAAAMNKSLTDLTAGAFDSIQDVIDKHELSDQAYKIKSGMPAVQEWYDEQLAMLDFLAGENRLTGGDYATHLADLNKAMSYKLQDLQGSAGNAIDQWDEFFRSMQLSDLSPGQSLEGYLAEYQQLKAEGDFSALADYVKSDFLPFVQAYTGGSVDYNSVYSAVMGDLQGMATGTSALSSVSIDAASATAIGQAVAAGMLSITDATGKEIVINLNLDSRQLDSIIAGLIKGGGLTFDAIQAVS